MCWTASTIACAISLLSWLILQATTEPICPNETAVQFYTFHHSAIANVLSPSTRSRTDWHRLAGEPFTVPVTTAPAQEGIDSVCFFCRTTISPSVQPVVPPGIAIRFLIHKGLTLA
ncbi:hypothetical protein BDN72DRAFT_678186 [Pluteus cervinus]|uniref:Uncharacterized protein n=1 Tax=Pluteus cervinus TaxID=181527 RepID=A0ACD3ARX3_9AGAR|nr:hypothetical protein BDN72DRAFT_678186 [Pluteus cervinus]